MTGVDWRGVRERVEALAALDAEPKVFGASGHRFRLHPVLPEAELAEFERTIGVRLPAEYRSFLLEVGAGGAGPDYGLERLERGAGGWGWTGHGVTTVTKLGVPFRPFDPGTYAAHEANQPVEADFPDRDAYLRAVRAWVRRSDELHDEETYGTIALSHQGCGYYSLLVVSGPERGRMWHDGRAGDMPLSPLVGPASPVTFGRWYLHWLARAAASSTIDSPP